MEGTRGRHVSPRLLPGLGRKQGWGFRTDRYTPTSNFLENKINVGHTICELEIWYGLRTNVVTMGFIDALY